MYYIYFLKSLRNGKVYIGQTSKNPLDRLKEHNAGHNIWTNNNKPFRLVYYENFLCKDDAVNRELFYKTGIGKKVKKAIIEAFADQEKPTLGS